MTEPLPYLNWAAADSWPDPYDLGRSTHLRLLKSEQPMSSAKDIPDAIALAACDCVAGGKEPPYSQLMARGFPEKVVYAKLAKLERRGFIEYGVSLRTGWLTDAGRAALQRLVDG